MSVDVPQMPFLLALVKSTEWCVVALHVDCWLKPLSLYRLLRISWLYVKRLFIYNHVHCNQSEFQQLIIRTFSLCIKLPLLRDFTRRTHHDAWDTHQQVVCCFRNVIRLHDTRAIGIVQCVRKVAVHLTFKRPSADRFISSPSPYRAVNNFLLGYKNQ
jgi:hypothetical protein